MERQTPDRRITGTVLVGLSQRAGAGANWPSRPDLGCGAAARPRHADHAPVVGGRAGELVRCRCRLTRWAPSRQSPADKSCCAVYPPRFHFWGTVAHRISLVQRVELDAP
ncbi:hypothetical protein NDU88_001623 [Pleurodeles waltl]|uniref:Uncharacterized protein n=1 Tax=Pleurodeles waltl TaxID=8319 RepID=A0AAV7UUR6_PLEWA|nr:hypothetical protein NDU88_001623 [Pleurodeles waltl]